MGMFDRLKLPKPLECPRCGLLGTWWAQFKFGASRLVDYEVGQRLRWDFDVSGERGHHRVIVQGITEGCPHCHWGVDDIRWEIVLIEIIDDVIASAQLDTGGGGWWPERDWRVVGE